VSEVKDSILLDFVHYMAELEQGLRQMMERLLARQEEAADKIAAKQEMKADINAQVADCQDQFKEDIKGHMEAFLDELRFCGKRTTACQVSSVASPNKSKAGLEVTETAVVTFKERLEKMEATDLEANPEATDAIVERQELRKRLVVWRRRLAKTRIQNSLGSPAEVVRHPETTDTRRRPCSTKDTYS
jgi:CHAT domain-containing protein